MKLHEVSPLTRQQIEFLDIYVTGTWSYNDQTKAVDVTGDMHMPVGTTSIPVQFGNVTGDFYCNGIEIASLQGAPQSVGGDFWCNSTDITSLQHAPETVGGKFVCSSTNITSLQGAPETINGDFMCGNTKITSLQGAPRSVGGDFFCNTTKITSLQHAPQSVGGDFVCHNTDITSLQHLPDVKRTVYINNTPYEQQVMPHILQLFKVKPRIRRISLSSKNDNQLTNILNKYLPTGDVLACQEELIDAGYGKIARF